MTLVFANQCRVVDEVCVCVCESGKVRDNYMVAQVFAERGLLQSVEWVGIVTCGGGGNDTVKHVIDICFINMVCLTKERSH